LFDAPLPEAPPSLCELFCELICTSVRPLPSWIVLLYVPLGGMVTDWPLTVTFVLVELLLDPFDPLGDWPPAGTSPD
jgi:hypothetical protein